MADYTLAYNHVLVNEGGYVNDPDDPGGETYKGVTRKYFPKWEGWTNVDLLKQKSSFPKNLDGDSELQEMIKSFYEGNFWDRVKGDDITDQDIATSIFDFAVNAGAKTSASLAQMVVGATADGIIGPKSIAAINGYNQELFIAKFTLAKISRYIHIVKNRSKSRKYFYGWVRRAIGE
ncbi:MAG: hypothetical protein PF481_06925 [Bacteroidales bacterium]|jgi:lysozyme family protein|nr:hypothetical protein [Bacteroidales bacterium]